MKYLQDAKERAGCGMPNWELYYEAATLHWIRDLIILEKTRFKIRRA